MDVWTGIVAVVAIASGAKLGQAWIQRHHGEDKANNELQRRLEKIESSVEHLRERVVTLERIVTDSSTQLDREIRGLSDEPRKSDDG